MSAPEGRHVRRKVPGRVWGLLLLAVGLVLLLPFWAAVLVLAAWDRLRGHRERDSVHPGDPKVYAPSEWWSQDERTGY